MIYNFHKSAKRRAIKDRGIQWKETYRKRSQSLKDKLEKEIGPSSYFRWEGTDYSTSSLYYIVVGPSTQKNIGKMWFAGIKKIPLAKITDLDTKTYAPYGEYFPSIKMALLHAQKRWGVIMPKDVPNYNRDNLQSINIPDHIK